ncbi:MAG TPA: 3-dehydroquinate synthase [Gemmatimonadales bacterium]|nr:3-dehydroquinate synthase [Gemmatimonadales bacterium]
MTHDGGRYPVYIDTGLLDSLTALVARHLPGRRTALISDAAVAALYADWREGGVMPWRPRERTCHEDPPSGWSAPFTFPAGEASKTRDTWARLTDEMFAAGYGRDSGIVALGGGVTGDLAGFVAATFARGVPFVQVPTTLLAMLDASVGGKTGVDTPHGKNLVGAFHPPAAVIADLLTLSTLSDREYRCGLAEAVKHGLIADAEHFGWIEQHAEALNARALDALETLVRRSVAIKAEIVASDEKESGRRAVLNAGHTVAHAIERETNYATLHGEAVAMGLVAECRLGEEMGVTEAGTADRVAKLLSRLNLPVSSVMPVPSLVSSMRHDKKSRGGEIRLAVPVRVGEAFRDGEQWTVRWP